MDDRERALILHYSNSDFKLRKLYDQHRQFEQQLETLSTRGFLTAIETVEEKRIKIEKLRGVEQMMGILHHYRDNGNGNGSVSRSKGR